MPGFNRNGGFAEWMLIQERMLMQLPSRLSHMDIAPMADVGLTAYSAVRKATEQLAPGRCTLVFGARGDRACGTSKKAGITADRS